MGGLPARAFAGENGGMPLPMKPLPMIERWSCHQCGVCCRGSIVPLSEDDRKRLAEQRWEERPEHQGQPVMVRESWLGHDYRLAQRDDGSCVFLMEDGLCRIHKELGFDAKPLVCRMFPLQVVPRDKVAYVTVRRACPSAAADKGQSVAEQMEFARALVRERNLAEKPPVAPAIKRGELREWGAAKCLLATFERLLTDERFPMVRRIVHALVVARLVEQAKTKGMEEVRLRELLVVLEQNAPGEVGELFTERRPASAAGAILFRQTAAEYVRLHPRFYVKPSWAERWRMFCAAWRVVRGKGELPRLHPSFPIATFEQLEEPLGALEAGVGQALTRLIETTAVSWSYALANRGGWSVVESLRMLAVSYAVGLWMLRWCAIGRKPNADDLPEIITALDRGQGYGPLAGGKQRKRVALLVGLGDLERLVVWYAR